MNEYRVFANDCDFGMIQAATEQEARDEAARMAGYLNEADMQLTLGEMSEIHAVLPD